MKLYVIYLITILLTLVSCKKDQSEPVQGASLTVINALVGSGPLVTNFSNDDISTGYYNALQVGFGTWSSNYQLGAYSGLQPLEVYQVPDTFKGSAPLYNLNLNLPLGSMQTLFFTGTIEEPDTLLTRDYPPYHANTDSSVGIRFINLSPASNAVNVVLSTSPTINEFTQISYKGVTEFKNYSVINSVSSYSFQVMDAVTNEVIASRTLNGINNGTGTNTSTNQYRYRNFTIALIGLPGGAGDDAQRLLLINNY